MIDQLAVAVDGLPLVLDEFVKELRENRIDATELDVSYTTLPAAVQLRLSRLPPISRAVLDALSVLGETDAKLLATANGLDDATVAAGIHDGLASTLLVPAARKLAKLAQRRRPGQPAPACGSAAAARAVATRSRCRSRRLKSCRALTRSGSRCRPTGTTGDPCLAATRLRCLSLAARRPPETPASI
jgi:hypothetical protein